MRIKIRKLAAALLCLALLGAFASCAEEEPTRRAEALSYEGTVIEDYVSLGHYTGLTVTLQEGEDRGSAVWRAVRERCELLGYPEEALAYYIEQAEARCRYYAEANDVSLEAAMAALGVSRESIEAEAQALVEADLVYLAVRGDANISLTEEEKQAHFDRYVEKYVRDWGYDRDYVVQNLSELVYDSMLYDKTTEYLIVHNTFAEET